MAEMDETLLFALSVMHFLTRKEKETLLERVAAADRLLAMSLDDISDILDRRCKSAEWNGAEVVNKARQAARVMRSFGIKYMLHKDFPEALWQTSDSPFMLFYRGDAGILRGNLVSVVGTRHPTPEGNKAAYDFAFDASNDGCVVVSGLAFGADKKAHEGSVAAGKQTVAVLPGGIDTIVPHSHTRLASRILECGGCLVSEYMPGVPAERWRFVQRNRIIASLSQGVVVIQAPPGSGALLTADFALDYSRDVMFHKAAFCTQALELSERIKKQLAIRVAHGEKKRYKLDSTPERYVQDGAPIISSYDDYKKCLGELPGARNCDIQLKSCVQEV